MSAFHVKRAPLKRKPKKRRTPKNAEARRHTPAYAEVCLLHLAALPCAQCEDSARVIDVTALDSASKHLQPLAKCELCYGDGWIADDAEDHRRCTEAEQAIFLERMGNSTGRMSCPRCALVIPKPELVFAPGTFAKKPSRLDRFKNFCLRLLHG